MKGKVVVFCVVITIFSIFTSMVYAGSLDNFKQNKIYQNNFEDINQNDWYYENVKIAYEKGLVNGTSEKTFNPTGNITVAETITLASRLHSIYMNDDYKFVANGLWYQPYLEYAIQKGIITEEQFNNYNNKATRAQFAMIFANALPSEALNTINDITSIPDVSKNVFYANDVYKLYKAGVLAGSDNYGTFNPDSNIQRSEVAAIVTRMADVNLRKNVTLDMKVSIENIQGVWGSDDVSEWVFSADNTFSYSLDRGYYIYECGTYSINGNVVTLNYNSKLYWDEDVGYKNYDVTTKTITIDKLSSTTMHFDPYNDLTRKQNSEITDKLEKHFENIGNFNMEVNSENIQGVWGNNKDIEWVFSNDNTFSYSVMGGSDIYTYYIYYTGTYSLNGNNITLNLEKRLNWDSDSGYEIEGAETRIRKIELNSTMMSLNSNILYKNASCGVTEKVQKHFANMEDETNEKDTSANNKQEIALMVVDLVNVMKDGAQNALLASSYSSTDFFKAQKYAITSYMSMIDSMQIVSEAMDLCGDYKDMQEAKDKFHKIYRIFLNCEPATNITSSNCSRITEEYENAFEETLDYVWDIINIENKWFKK